MPEDHDQLMFYKESKTGQVLQEGINEAGAMSDWIAAATYSVHNEQMIPFYICYSMFGLQRTMDLYWAAADQRARLPDRRHGRPHDAQRRRPAARDGHSLVPLRPDPELRQLRPDLPVRNRRGGSCRTACAACSRAGRRLLLHHRDERELRASGDAAGAEQDIIKGMYLLKKRRADPTAEATRVQLLGSGTIFREVIAAARTAQERLGVDADLWGAELQRTGA